jgi:hypothetical protein
VTATVSERRAAGSSAAISSGRFDVPSSPQSAVVVAKSRWSTTTVTGAAPHSVISN